MCVCVWQGSVRGCIDRMSSRPNRRSGGASGPYRGGKGVHGGREGRPEGHRSQNQQATEASEPKKWQQEPSNHAGYIKQLFEKSMLLSPPS